MQAEGKGTKYIHPNITKYDAPATKKCRTMQQAPDIHVSVNITPAPGAVDLGMQAKYQILKPSAPAANVVPLDTKSSSAPGPSRSSPSPQSARLLTLLDCVHAGRTPSVCKLLTLMDREEPMANLKFKDSRLDMEDFGMENAKQVSKMPVVLLTSMGPLRRAGTQHVHEYCQEKILKPLGKGVKRSSSEASVEEIPPPLVGIKKE